MTVLAYEVHENLLTHHDVMEKLKDFAVAQGWTLLDWRKNNCAWAWTGSQYDFVAGSESFLMIQSSGYGSQVLHYRLRGEASGSDPNSEYIRVGSPNPANTAIDYALSTHPEAQYSWHVYHLHSIKPVDIPKIWLFGNDKFLSVVAQCDNVWCMVMGFGSLEVLDATETGGYFASYTNSAGQKWYNYAEWTFADTVGFNHWHEGRVKSVGDVVSSCAASSQGFVSYYDLVDDVQENLYSEARPLFKPMMSMEFDSDGKWKPVGAFPIFRVSAKDFDVIGKELVYGTKKYIAFPRCKLNESSRYFGIAYRTQ